MNRTQFEVVEISTGSDYRQRDEMALVVPIIIAGLNMLFAFMASASWLTIIMVGLL
jgi:hypothetical protein